MTDDSTDTLTDPPPAEPPATVAETTEVAARRARAEPVVPFWHRPNVERYLLPLVLPIVVVVGLVVYVLNLSRVFLSGHGHIPTVVGSTVLVVILIGATVFSNAVAIALVVDRVDDRDLRPRDLHARGGSCSGTRRNRARPWFRWRRTVRRSTRSTSRRSRRSSSHPRASR